MKTISKTLFTRLALVFIFLALLPPQLVKADEVTDKNSYKISLNGQYTVKFTMPVKRWTGNLVDEGTVKFTVEGEKEVHTCFVFRGLDDDTYDDKYDYDPGDDEWGNDIKLFFPTRYVVTPSNKAALTLYGSSTPKWINFISKATKFGKDSEKWWGMEVEWTVPGLRGI